MEFEIKVDIFLELGEFKFKKNVRSHHSYYDLYAIANNLSNVILILLS